MSDYSFNMDIVADIPEPINIFYVLINDIVHLHIYPFIVFMIIRNINSTHFNIFLRNICLIISMHIYFMIINESYLIKFNQTTIQLRCWNSFKYILILEFIGYWYHRISHSDIFYGKLHTHEYPYDYLMSTKYDIIARAVYTYMPLWIIPMTYFDFMMIYYLYIYLGFLSDTNMFIRIHRHTKKYNYSIGFPIYDYCFGTYLSRDEFLIIRPNNE
jgi:sterol desaturase/sphingolipid hydroxylase (fatty acid hydroxylase superfamily)